jgi:hypothetical protein
MSIQGNLETMSLDAILRWVAEHSETGVLELEKNKVCKRIAFRKGEIIGCTSDDPPARIGQFLLARGKISRESLAEALRAQKETGISLGTILQDMGEIEAEELAYELSAKAEENIFSLFDWKQAVFRFKQGEPDDPWLLDFHASVDDVLQRGLQRVDQLDAIRRLFISSGVVLEHGLTQVPPQVLASGLARRIMESIDGQKTIGEILLHAHASEFLVLKFLASSVHSGFVSIASVGAVNAQHPTLLDTDESRAKAAKPAAQEPEEFVTTVPAPKSTFEEKLELAQHFLAQAETEAALDVLDECYEERPGDEYLGHMIQKAETAFITGCRDGDFQGRYIPVRVEERALELEDSTFTAAERFLMGMVGERHAIQTLLWVAPMREVDVYRALLRMKRTGAIDLQDAGEIDLEGTAAPSVEWA